MLTITNCNTTAAMTSRIDMIKTRATSSTSIAPSDFFSCELFNVHAGRDAQNAAQTEFSKSRFARMLSRSMKTGLFENRRMTMAKVAWSRDGDQWVGKLNLGEPGTMEARITEWCGPLGDEFVVQVRGSHVVTCGGGTRKDALARAKKAAEEKLRSEAEKFKAAA